MADTRVDILLALRTSLQGNAEALAYLDKFETSARRTTRSASSEWERMARTLDRKFSAGDIFKSVLGGLGVGSGMAIATRAAEMISGHWERAAKAAEQVDAVLARSAAATEKLLRLRRTDEQELAKLRNDSAKDQAALNQLQNPTEKYNVVVGRNGRQGVITEERTRRREMNAEEIKAASELTAILQERAVTIAEMEKAQAKDRERQDEEINKSEISAAQATEAERERAAEDAKKTLEERRKLSDAIRDSTSEEAKYRAEVEKINALRGVKNGLTEAEANAAINRLNIERAAAPERAAIEAERDAAENRQLRLREQLAALDGNYSLTEAQKWAERKRIMEDAVTAAKDYLAAVTRLRAAATSDEAKRTGDTNVRAAGRDVSQAQSALAGIGPNPESLDATLTASIISAENRIGTVAQQLTRVFDQVGESIRTSLGSALADAVLYSGSAKDKIINFGNAIGLSFIQTSAQMVADWIYKHTILAAVRKIFHIQDVAGTAAAEGSKTAITTTGTFARIALGLKEAGVWLIQSGIKAMSAVASIPYVGPILAIAALAAVIAAGAKAMKGLHDGGHAGASGYTAGVGEYVPAGVVHGGEWVAPKWMVEDPQLGAVIAGLEGERRGVAGHSIGGFIKKFTGWDTAGQFLGSGFLPKWATLPAFQRFQRDHNLLDGKKLYGETDAAVMSYDDATGRWIPDTSPVGALTRPAYEPAAAGGAGVAYDGSSSGRSLTVALLDPQNDRDVIASLERDPRADVWFERMLHRKRFTIPGVRV